jgi:hypothetical protein
MIKPIKEENEKSLYFKFFLILSLLLLSIVFKPSIKKVEAPEVLGEKINSKNDFKLDELKNEINSKIDTILKTIKTTGEKTVDFATDTISQTASKSAQNISNFIFEQAINNIIKEVEKLPLEQQEKIKEKLCQ